MEKRLPSVTDTRPNLNRRGSQAVLLSASHQLPDETVREVVHAVHRGPCPLCGGARSMLFGWWGVPWGVIMTVVQVSRNLFGVWRSPDDGAPSVHLQRLVRLQLARDMVSGPSDQR